MIQAKNISFKTGNNYLVQDISLTLEAGMLHLIVGPNGAGKSTVIKLLSGQLKPSSGSLQYNGQPLEHYDTSELARMRAVLSQSQEISFPMCVSEVVMMGRYPHFTG